LSKRRKNHRSSDDNIVINRKSNGTRKIDNSHNNDNNDNSIIVVSQDFTHLEIPVGNLFQPSITFCKSRTSMISNDVYLTKIKILFVI
jgi:hypothetical protein